MFFTKSLVPSLKDLILRCTGALIKTVGLVVLTIICYSNVLNAQIALYGLQVNYQTTPLGTDAEDILFSWKLINNTDERSLAQRAYQIVVKNEMNEVVWDTKKVSSSLALAIHYEGQSLAPRTRYLWTVDVYDHKNRKVTESSWFETGLRNPNSDLSAWNGAKWIGGGEEDMVLQSHYLTVFKIQYQLQLEEESTKAAFLFGSNDKRLMDENFNLHKINLERDQSYVSVELDISPLEKNQKAKLNIYRVGFIKENKSENPLLSFDVPLDLINKDNKYDKHTIYLDVVFGMMEFYINGRKEENHINKKEAQGYLSANGDNINPYGEGGDFIAFPVLGDVGFKIDNNQNANFSNLQIRNFRAPSNIIFSENLSDAYSGIFKEQKGLSISNGGYALTGGKEGSLILADPSQNAAPMLRTQFSVENQKIKKARIYATARGIYELYLNGQRVGKDYFNPGLTQYNKHHMYQTYDVTNLIKNGEENALGAWLSEGWWSGNATFKGENWNFFGDRQSLLTQLVITYTDGTEKIVTSNPEEWKLFTDGPIKYGSFFQGEIYDATKEVNINGWAEANFDDGKWMQSVEVHLNNTAVVGPFFDFVGRPQDMDYSNQKLIGQIGENVTVVTTLSAQSVTEVRPKVFVYDMGQNMVGVPNIEIENGKKGEVITLRYAEVKYPDLAEYSENKGMIMLENIRAALAQDQYTLKGGNELISPRFTFHGYRYIEITGIEEAIPLEMVEGKVLSSVRKLASSYETSNELVNKLWSNITWSLRSNFLSIPTDCPARNERMGWNGDISVFAKTATWLTDSNPFLKRHLMAMRDMQATNGRFSDVAPIGNGFGGTLWGSAGIVLPWETYQQYGDISLLEEHYDAMKSYVDFLSTRQDPNGVLLEGPLGDWLSPENNQNDNTLFWTAYQVYDLQIVKKVAEILGRDDDARILHDQFLSRKAFFNNTYFDGITGKSLFSSTSAQGFEPPPANAAKKGDIMDTQASYAIPLGLDVLNDKNRVLATANLAKTVARKNIDDLGVERPEYSLMTGFIGTAAIGDALSRNGRSDVMYELLQSETYPSWLYPVKNGATTIWERLNSYTLENGFGGNNSMNSFNHYAFGAIASWMYNYSLGIQRGNDGGFKNFKLKPTPDPTGKMTFAKGYYDSTYGRIESAWHNEGDHIRYKISVPPNSSAKLYLTARKVKHIRENGKKVKKIKGIKSVSKMNNYVLLELGSGKYEFVVKK